MRNWKQRLWSLLLCGAMLAGLCPAALAEDSSIPYRDEKGDKQHCATYTLVTDSNTEWDGGWYVVQNTVNIGKRVTVNGDVHLILTDGCKLNATDGINVSKGNSLTIYAQSTEGDMGTLYAISGDPDAAGIGGEITISENADVTATSKINGAGIGGPLGRRRHDHHQRRHGDGHRLPRCGHRWRLQRHPRHLQHRGRRQRLYYRVIHQ